MEDDELIRLANAEPRTALGLVEELLGRESDPARRSVLLRARGMAERESVGLDAAAATLGESARMARAVPDPELEGMAQLSLSSVLGRMGRTAEAIELLDRLEESGWGRTARI